MARMNTRISGHDGVSPLLVRRGIRIGEAVWQLVRRFRPKAAGKTSGLPRKASGRPAEAPSASAYPLSADVVTRLELRANGWTGHR